VSRVTSFLTQIPVKGDRRSWLVLLAALGVFFAADDQTSVVAILPAMIDGVGLSQDQFFRAAWIVNGYILGYVVAMPLMGRISDSFGHGRVFALSVALFCAGSAWVALAGDLTVLTIGRAVQAVGGGALVPVAMAIVTAYAPRERRAIGLGAMAAASEAGGLLGPLWGGGIAEAIGWRGVFWINLPMCLPIALAVWRLSRDSRPELPEKVDFLGAALLGGSLVCLTIALTNDPIVPRPLGVTLMLYGGAVLLFAAFILRQLGAVVPLVNPAMFRQLKIGAAFLANGLMGGTLIVAMVNVPLFSNVILDTSALEGGLNLMRLTVALPIGALLGGVLAQRWGLAGTAALGLTLAGAGFVGMSRWSADPTFTAMTLPLLIGGFGFGLVIAPLGTAVLDTAPETERATAASLLTVVRLLGALVGVALLTTQGLSGFYAEAGLVPLDDPRFAEILRGLELDSFHDTFLVAAVVSFVSVLPALLLGRGETDDIS
jgi:EmrB/QacA subfamily drug resistance transporter